MRNGLAGMQNRWEQDDAQSLWRDKEGIMKEERGSKKIIRIKLQQITGTHTKVMLIKENQIEIPLP